MTFFFDCSSTFPVAVQLESRDTRELFHSFVLSCFLLDLIKTQHVRNSSGILLLWLLYFSFHFFSVFRILFFVVFGLRLLAGVLGCLFVCCCWFVGWFGCSCCLTHYQVCSVVIYKGFRIGGGEELFKYKREKEELKRSLCVCVVRVPLCVCCVCVSNTITVKF